MIPMDTSDAAYEAQMSVYRRMSPVQRLLLAFDMCDDARALTSAGIRLRNPGWNDAEVRTELRRVIRAAACRP